MPQLGPLEILVILVVALLVFGPRRLPEIGRQVGAALRELRNFQHEIRGHLDSVVTEDASHGQQAPPKLPPKDPDRVAREPAVAARPAPGRFHAPRRPATGPATASGGPAPSPGPPPPGPATRARPAPTRFRPPERPWPAAHRDSGTRDVTTRPT